jgi:hypothetical protein
MVIHTQYLASMREFICQIEGGAGCEFKVEVI